MRKCPHCSDANVAPYGTYRTKAGKRRRYRCRACNRTFSVSTGAAHHRIQYPSPVFERVMELTRAGWKRSAIARAAGVSWNTVARWQARMAGTGAGERDPPAEHPLPVADALG